MQPDDKRIMARRNLDGAAGEERAGVVAGESELGEALQRDEGEEREPAIMPRGPGRGRRR